MGVKIIRPTDPPNPSFPMEFELPAPMEFGRPQSDPLRCSVSIGGGVRATNPDGALMFVALIVERDGERHVTNAVPPNELWEATIARRVNGEG